MSQVETKLINNEAARKRIPELPKCIFYAKFITCSMLIVPSFWPNSVKIGIVRIRIPEKNFLLEM